MILNDSFYFIFFNDSFKMHIVMDVRHILFTLSSCTIEQWKMLC